MLTYVVGSLIKSL